MKLEHVARHAIQVPTLPRLLLIFLGEALLQGCGLRDKSVYSEMAVIVTDEVRLPLFKPVRSRSGYTLYVFPTRSSGHATKGELYEFRQIIALDVSCSVPNSVCEWDPDKNPDIKCSQVRTAIEDDRTISAVRTYLRSQCADK